MPELTTALSGAVARGEITAVFQPQIDLESNRIVAAEALCRWTHPDLGAVAPVDFIAAAEDAGLIEEVGRYMAEQCCSAMQEWSIDVSVNVSPVQLETPEFTEWLAASLSAHPRTAGTLTLEITESRAISDVAPVLLRLEPLRAMGVGVALDDFGTGHSSITQLKRLHGTEVKLDRSIVIDFSDEAHDRMAAVIKLAHASGIRVVAEGIETFAHLERCRRLACDRGQGYLIARPMSRQELTLLLTSAA